MTIYTLHAFSPGAGAIFKKGKHYYASSIDDPGRLTPMDELMVSAFIGKWGYQKVSKSIRMDPNEWPERVRKLRTSATHK